MQQKNDFKCADCKCALSLIHPNSDADLACDSACYFSKDGDGHENYKRFSKKYEQIFKDATEED